MSIFNRLLFDPLAQAIIKAQRTEGPPPHLLTVAQANAPVVDKRQLYENQAKAMAACSWVYKAVSNLAEAAALVPLHVYKRVQEELEEVVDHEFELLLRKPNPYQSQFEFMECTFGSLCINGNAFWYVRPTLATTPGELYPLRPDRMKAIPSESEFLAGWQYEIEGKTIDFRADEVVQFKLFGPKDDYLGLSPIEALAYAVGNDTEAQERNYYRQRNNARADGIMVSDQEIAEQDLQRIRRSWEKEHKGSENTGKIAWLWGGWKWQEISLTPQEMQFIEGRKLSQEEVYQIYGIPMGMWSENATEANAKVGLKVFYNFGLWPKLCRVASKVTSSLMPRYGDDMVAQFEDVRVEDREILLAEIETAMRVKTINELRREYYHMDELDGGDVILDIKGGILSDVGEAPEKPPPPQFGQAPPQPPEQEQEEQEEAESEAAEAEMAKWQKWALARIGTDRWPPERQFETRFVRAHKAAWIQANLDEAKTEQEVKAAFAAPFPGYP